MRKAILGSICLMSFMGCTPYKSHLSSVSIDGRTLFQRKTAVAFREAAAALGDSNHRGLAAPGSLGMLALGTLVDQTCTDRPDGAVINIRSSESSSFQMDTPTQKSRKDIFVNAEVERAYTGGDDLECARKQPIIEVDLDRHLLTLKLAVKYRREEKTFLSNFDKTDATGNAAAAPTETRQMSNTSALLEGTRTVTFTEDLGEVEDEVSYGKDSQGQGTRTDTVETSGGSDIELQFTLESAFKMVDTYEEHPHNRAIGKGPIRKEVKTGRVKSTLAGQGSVETTFTDLRLEFNQGACQATAGKIQSRYFNEGNPTAVKTIDFDVAANAVAVSDTLGADHTAAALDPADILSSMDLQKELCSDDAFTD